MECRFLKPVYDGRSRRSLDGRARAGLDLEVQSGASLRRGDRDLAGGGRRRRLGRRFRRLRTRPRRERPPAAIRASPGHLARHGADALTPEAGADYLRDVRETDAIYAREGLVHPGADSQALQPGVRQRGAAALDPHRQQSGLRGGARRRRASVRARVAANYERKGHRLVDLDAL